MPQPTAPSLFDTEPPVLGVNDVIELMNEALKTFQVTVRGEITQISNRGHIYFTISDTNPKVKAVLSCALWKFRAERLPFKLEEGMEVQIKGQPNLYAPNGRLTFIVEHISPVGEGALKKAFEQLKKMLNQEGLFAPEQKKALPIYPQTIGVITSSQGDAIKDFRTHLGQFGYRVFLKDVRVEGLNAINSIVAAIEWFNKYPNGTEVLVLTRGGGSLESLQAFNSEAVARAIFASKIPVVSAIGHENDVTISDLVADARASTPTDAGKLVSHFWSIAPQTIQEYQFQLTREFSRKHRETRGQIQHAGERLLGQWQQQLRHHQSILTNIKRIFLNATARQQLRFLSMVRQWQHVFSQFSWRCKQQQNHLVSFAPNWSNQFSRQHRLQQQQLSQCKTILQLADPEQLLQKGYSLQYTQDGQLIKHASQLTQGSTLYTKLAWGEVQSTIQTWTTKKNDNS